MFPFCHGGFALSPLFTVIRDLRNREGWMRRRGFLTGTAILGVVGPAYADSLPVPPGNRIAFKVFRNGAAVGEHDVTFTQSGDSLTAVTNFAFIVTLAGIPVYHYTLTATEIWSAGVFQSLATQVNNNGTMLEVHAKKTAAGYDVTDINHNDPSQSYPEYTAPPDTMPLSYWNKAMLNGPVLNLDTAHSYPVIKSSPGWNSLPTANGANIVAQRFDLTGKLHLSCWYDQYNQWAGLQFSLHGNWNYEKII